MIRIEIVWTEGGNLYVCLLREALDNPEKLFFVTHLDRVLVSPLRLTLQNRCSHVGYSTSVSSWHLLYIVCFCITIILYMRKFLIQLKVSFFIASGPIHSIDTVWEITIRSMYSKNRVEQTVYVTNVWQHDAPIYVFSDYLSFNRCARNRKYEMFFVLYETYGLLRFDIMLSGFVFAWSTSCHDVHVMNVTHI